MKHFKAAVLLGLVMTYSPILVAQSPAPIVRSQSTQDRLERLERRVKSLTEIMLHIDRLQQEMRELRGEVEVQAHAQSNEATLGRGRALDSANPVQTRSAGDASNREVRPPSIGRGTTCSPPRR